MGRNAERQRLAKVRHYERNRDVVKARAKAFNVAARLRNKALLLEHRQAHPCADCGESDPIVLDFDHVRGLKLDEVCNLAMKPCSAEVLLAEIAKCDVRCANCHRRRTHRERLLAA